MYRSIILIALILFSTTCRAQTICEQLRALKQQAYGFKPSAMTRKKINERLINVDKFWDLAKADKPGSEVCLRQMILDEKDDQYFCYDASALLITMDTQQQNLDVAVEGLKKCDLNDLQLDAYLDICFFLGGKGEDISALAEKLISYPDAHIFLINHALLLNAAHAGIFLYNVMGTTKAEDALSKAIANGNATARHNAAIILNLISTPGGDSLINGLIANRTLADSTIAIIKKDREDFTVKTSCNGSLFKGRASILERLKNFPGKRADVNWGFADNDGIICSASKLLQAQDIDTIRAARDRSTWDISDESLDEYLALTKILITVRHR